MEEMPVVFIGHGSPTNALGTNRFTRQWQEIAARIPKPEAILCVSAHWYGEGDYVSATPRPETIYDFYGFPPELYALEYPAPGAPELARLTTDLLGGREVRLHPERGLDHGAWCVLRAMYPEANIPVCQLSVNSLLSPRQSHEQGQQLRPLREESVLILGSGNIVHNLGLVNWGMETGYPWADHFDAEMKNAVTLHQYDRVMNYKQAGNSSGQAFIYRDHFDPLLYVLGATDARDRVSVFADERVLGSISMTSYLFER